MEPTATGTTESAAPRGATERSKSPWLLWAGGLPLWAVGFVRQLPARHHWHVDDDVNNLRWAIVHRHEPWVAFTELTPMHGHVRPMTLFSQWVGAWLGNGSWEGIHAVHTALGALALPLLAGIAFHRRGAAVALLTALLFVLQPPLGELPWWNAWMCTAGELAAGLGALLWLQRDLERSRWPVGPALLLVVSGAFKEPGWVVYPLVGAALAASALAKARSPQRWAALALPLLGAGGLALTYSPENVARLDQGKGDFLHAVGDWLAPIVGPAPDPVAGLALPVPLVALALLTRIGLRPLHAALASLAIWGASLHHEARGALLLVLLAGAGISEIWRRKASPGVWLAILGIGVMLPFPYPHPVQVAAGLAGLSLLVAESLWGLAGRLTLPWRAGLGAFCLLTLVGAGLRQPEPLDGPWPHPQAGRSRQSFLGALATAQATGASALYAEDAADLWELAILGGIRRSARSDGGSLWLDEVILIDAQPPSAPDLLEGLQFPRERLGRPRPPGSVPPKAPELDLAPGTYLLALETPDAASVDALGLEATGDCGLWQLRTRSEAGAIGTLMLLDAPCTVTVRRDPGVPGVPHLYALQPARLDFRDLPAASPSPQPPPPR